MVGLLIADKTPSKPPKKAAELKKRKHSNSRVDNTDSEGDENGGKGGVKKTKKDHVETKIVLPKNVKYLKRFVTFVLIAFIYIIICITIY